MIRLSGILKVQFLFLILAMLLVISGTFFIQSSSLVAKSLKTESTDNDYPSQLEAEIDLADLGEMEIDRGMAERVTHVIIGDVESVESRWNDDKTLIYTYVRISVEDCLQGSLECGEVTIKELGGEVGEIGLLVSNKPSFVKGERAKVFLKREGTDEFSIVGKTSLNSEISSGYSYSGFHWPSGDLPVEYYINELGTPDTTNEFMAVQASFKTWEDDPGSYMDYTYIGTTHRVGEVRDGYNVVSWGSIDGAGGTLAQTTIWYYASNKLIYEFDMVFDDAETWSTTGGSGKYDVQNIGTHEAGHTLSLDDLYDLRFSEETMYGYAYPGETKKRTLNEGDIAGIRHIYGNLVMTYIINTEPEGLQIKVDGVDYIAPNSFDWDTGSTHMIEAPSPQSGGVDMRYVYKSWNDDGARVHSITVGESNTTMIARFNPQYSVEFSITTLGLSPTNSTNYVAVTYFANEESETVEIWDGAPSIVWCDVSSIAEYGNPSSGSTSSHRWYTFEDTSLEISSPAEVMLTYYEQFLTSYIFKDADGRTIVPTSFSTTSPYDEDSTFTDYTDLWLDFGVGTVREILWGGVDVKPETNLSFNIASSKVWTIDCAVYDLKIKVTDLFGLPISEATVSITFPNGTIVTTQTNRDGGASISQVTKGQYTAVITSMRQTTTISGDVAQAAVIPAQAKIYFSVPVIVSIFGVILTVAIVKIFLKKKRSSL
ncbi:MAG: matrixin family metalloprotease [Candidatus Methylarchaceae archaeon HK02M1]|nr:matrixin family metalloprotease [Candidatus Methylarchaceae archaeon HK02M1]